MNKYKSLKELYFLLKMTIIQKIINILFNIYNSVNSIGSIFHPPFSNQNMNILNMIKQLSLDDINYMNNLTESMSKEIFEKLEKIRQCFANNRNTNTNLKKEEYNINKNYKNELTGNEKKKKRYYLLGNGKQSINPSQKKICLTRAFQDKTKNIKI